MDFSPHMIKKSIARASSLATQLRTSQSLVRAYIDRQAQVPSPLLVRVKALLTQVQTWEDVAADLPCTSTIHACPMRFKPSPEHDSSASSSSSSSSSITKWGMQAFPSSAQSTKKKRRKKTHTTDHLVSLPNKLNTRIRQQWKHTIQRQRAVYST